MGRANSIFYLPPSPMHRHTRTHIQHTWTKARNTIFIMAWPTLFIALQITILYSVAIIVVFFFLFRFITYTRTHRVGKHRRLLELCAFVAVSMLRVSSRPNRRWNKTAGRSTHKGLVAFALNYPLNIVCNANYGPCVSQTILLNTLSCTAFFAARRLRPFENNVAICDAIRATVDYRLKWLSENFRKFQPKIHLSNI